MVASTYEVVVRKSCALRRWRRTFAQHHHGCREPDESDAKDTPEYPARAGVLVLRRIEVNAVARELLLDPADAIVWARQS